MDNESAKSMLYVHDLPSNYQEESSAEHAAGNQSIRTGEVMREVGWPLIAHSIYQRHTVHYYLIIIVHRYGKGTEEELMI